jgi:hypothetical protein
MLDLNVVFDESVKDSPVTIELNEVTMAKALDIILKIYKYSFEQVDNRTILVYADNPTNRPRFETLMVKTFYLGNLTSQQARTALTRSSPAGRQIASLDQPNNARWKYDHRQGDGDRAATGPGHSRQSRQEQERGRARCRRSTRSLTIHCSSLATRSSRPPSM